MSIEATDKKKEIWYVWIKSERIGDIVQPLDEQNDPMWYKFTDGTQINKSLIHEFLMQANSEREAVTYAKDLGLVANVKKQKNISNFQTPQTSVNNTIQPVEINKRRITDGKSSPDKEVNVMMEMLKKISKKNQAEMPVLINIPAKEVYQMLKDQMDLQSDELNEQISMLVESQIDNLREQLKEQIETFIFNYYTNEHRENN